MRAAEDVEHTLNIESFRTNPVPVTSTFLKSLRPLTTLDVNQDPSWMDAPVVVTTNAERLSIIKAQVIRFSKARSIPVISWRQPLSATCKLSENDKNVLYEIIDKLVGWFAYGAPVHLTTNINPSKHLANGTEVTQCSVTSVLCFPTELDHADLNEQLKGAIPGSKITLSCVPTSVNVIVHGINKREWPDCQSLVKDNCVIPLKLNKRPESLSRSDRRLIKYHDFEYALAFSVTYHKIQGKTVNKLILDINKSPMSSLSLQSLYLGISRVRCATDFRVLPPLSLSNIGWSYLKGLHHKKEYTYWFNSYKDHIVTMDNRTESTSTECASSTVIVPTQSILVVSKRYLSLLVTL